MSRFLCSTHLNNEFNAPVGTVSGRFASFQRVKRRYPQPTWGLGAILTRIDPLPSSLRCNKKKMSQMKMIGDEVN